MFAPIVQSCFGIPVQLFNHYGKYLCGGHEEPHGHHDPNHGFAQSSYWYIEVHEGLSDKVRLRNMNGKYLCHEGHSKFCSMHHNANSSDVAWHMDSFPSYGGQSVIFRSHRGHYLGLDQHDHHVHCKQHMSEQPHESQRFEVRYIPGFAPTVVASVTTQISTPNYMSPTASVGFGSPYASQTMTPPGNSMGYPQGNQMGYQQGFMGTQTPAMPAYQQTTTYYETPTGMPAYQNSVTGIPAFQTTVTDFAPIVVSCFGRPVQLFNHYGKFLCGGDHNAHGHINPNHGFNQSSYWFIEKHDGFTDKVRLRNINGKFLCHDGHSQFCSMHHNAYASEVAWHMDVFPGFGGQNVIFRSHGGHFLGLDEFDHQVHCRHHPSGQAHESQRFEVRFV